MLHVRLDARLGTLSCRRALDALISCYATSSSCNPESILLCPVHYLFQQKRAALSSDVNDFKDAQ